MFARVDESLERGRDKIADQLGVLLDQVVVRDDAVAHRVDAAVGKPEYPRLHIAADLHARRLSLDEAGDRRDLPGDQRRRGAGRIDVDHADLGRVEPAALGEGRPLQELRRSGGDGDRLAFQILRRGDGRILAHDHASRIAPIDRRDRADVHAFRHAVSDDEAVGESDLRRLAGDELRGAARTLALPHVDVETGLLVEALVHGRHEAGVRTLVDPVEAKCHIAQLGLGQRRTCHGHGDETCCCRGATQNTAAAGRFVKQSPARITEHRRTPRRNGGS